MSEITVVRHGRSEANAAGVWQGSLNSSLTEDGLLQAEQMAGRFRDALFDRVISSDLDRARQTADSLSIPVTVDPAWREMDLGDWEGKTFEEVQKTAGDLLKAIRSGESLPFGETGETLRDFEGRCVLAMRSLLESLDGGRALVISHGGVVDALMGSIVGRAEKRRTFPIVSNTALTVIRDGARGPMVRRFNDATHLGRDESWVSQQRAAGVPVVAFVRHGVTRANKDRLIQGQQCWGLDDEGRRQSRALAGWYGPVDRVITSPLARAMETAEALANGHRPTVDARVQEMAFGAWEGRHYHDLFDSGDDLVRRIYREGEDLPRGGDGETFAQVTERMRSFLDDLEVDPSERVVVVSHGAAIRALVAVITAAGPSVTDALVPADNTGITHVALTEEGPMLADYSLIPHLG